MSLPPLPSAGDYVYVPVPADKVEAVLRFLLGLDGQESSALEARVARVYRESDEHFRDLLRLLAEHPGEAHSTAWIADRLGLASGAGSLAGMLGAYARRAKNRYDGFWPFERLYNPTTDRSELMMSPMIAAAVNLVIEGDR